MSRYKLSHKISKVIVTALVISLWILSIHLNNMACIVLAVCIDKFGVNFFAYVIESVLRWEHEHDKL